MKMQNTFQKINSQDGDVDSDPPVPAVTPSDKSETGTVHDSNALVEDIFEVNEQIPDDEEEVVESLQNQKSKNLNKIFNKTNYANAPAQPNLIFDFSDARKAVSITWNTVREANLHRRCVENIMNKQPHPRRAAKYMKTPLKAFQLFFRDDIINKVVLYTNAFIQPLIESISVVFENSDKHPHLIIVGYIDI